MAGKASSDAVQMKKTTSSGSQKDGSSLKRGREGSQEPSTLPNVTASTKKNRPDPAPTSALATASSASAPPHARSGTSATETSTISEEDAPRNSIDEAGEGGEGRNIGEVRRKVASMTHEDQQAQSAESAAEGQEVAVPAHIKADDPGSAMSTDTAAAAPAENEAKEDIGEGWVDVDKSAAAGIPLDPAAGSGSGSAGAGAGEGLKRKAIDRSESSLLAVEGSKRQKETPSPPPTSADLPDTSSATTASSSTPAPSTAPADPPKKTQPTFASFSSASPFLSSAARTSSPFASASSSNAFASASTRSKPSAFASSGFGGFSAAASPFASKKTVPAPKPKAVPTDDEQAEDEEQAEETEEAKNFGDILAQGGGEEESGEKVKMTEQDVSTGEEDEETIFSNRVKLYVMEGDGAWKERGVGMLKLNVRASDGSSPRLVMRADGVLRVILNAKLYSGMTAPQDGRHVRTTIFEDGQKKFITFRTQNAKTAGELSGHIHDQIPFGKSASESRSPEPPRPGEAIEV